MSVSHQDKPFRLKNSQKLLFFGQNRGKQTKPKTFLENRQTWCWSITYFSNPDIRRIGKKLDHFKVKSQRGVGTRNSDPSKSPHLSVWNHEWFKKMIKTTLAKIIFIDNKSYCPFYFCPWWAKRPTTDPTNWQRVKTIALLFCQKSDKGYL